MPPPGRWHPGQKPDCSTLGRAQWAWGGDVSTSLEHAGILGAGNGAHIGPQGHFCTVNGAAGVVVAPRGQVVAVAGITVAHGRIVEIELLADPAGLRELDLALMDD